MIRMKFLHLQAFSKIFITQSDYLFFIFDPDSEVVIFVICSHHCDHISATVIIVIILALMMTVRRWVPPAFGTAPFGSTFRAVGT